MNYNPTPRSEFLKDAEAIKSHHVLVENPILRRSIEIALLEMNRQICNNCPPDNMGGCAAAHLRMLGAQDFIQVFLNLAEESSAPPRKDTSNLPSNVSSLPRK